MARSTLKSSFKTKVAAPKAFGGKGSSMSKPSSSPLMKLGRKDYSKKSKSPEVQQFGAYPGFGLTGMTGED